MEWLVTIHSYWRYLVLIAAIVAVVLSLLAYLGSRPWDRLTDRASLIFTIAMDVQLLIGILVWLLADYSPDNSYLRWIHPLMMIVAVAIAHVGRARADRAEDSRAKGLQATIFFVLSLVVVLVAIPVYSWHL
jgi:hypothetical protein